jgi:hypothetical protein
MQPGGYRVTVREDGTSEITVRSGAAEVDSGKGGEHLQPGQTMEARGPAADAEFQTVQAIPYDNFDRWNEERDHYIENSQSARHMSPDIPGSEDLDHNGQWVNDPTYGQVWQPTNVGPGWAPYQNGQWAWEDYYGWTWVSYDPWGWAPYHYGRWFYGGAGWAWYPGAVFAHPYWAPAYVGFFGWGGGVGVGVGFGFGGVGWVALAPFEGFHPWWGRGFYGGFAGGYYGNHTTFVNNANVYNSYRNARVAGGVMGVNTGGFGHAGAITTLNRSQIQSASLVHGVLPVAPDRSSLRMSNRAVSGRYPQSSARSFASHMQTPRVQHASFEQQQRGMQQISRGNFSSPASRGSVGGASRFGNSGESHGWSRFGEPIHGTSGGANGYSRGYGGAANGFQRYDQPRSGAGSASGYARGGQAVRINPSIVEPRASSPGSNARGFGGNSRGLSGGESRGGGGGSARPSGGGGHSGGGGGHAGHR